MSKFEQDIFHDDDGVYYAASRERYSLEEAEGLAKRNLDCDAVKICSEYTAVRHRAGIDFEGRRHVGWWVECEQKPRSCPAWVFVRQEANCGDTDAWTTGGE